MPPSKRAEARRSPRAATVSTAKYDEAWEVGKRAPKDQYRTVGQDGAYTDDPSDKPTPGAYQRQVAAKGDVITAATRLNLGLDVAAPAVVTTPAAEPDPADPAPDGGDDGDEQGDDGDAAS